MTFNQVLENVTTYEAGKPIELVPTTKFWNIS
jgi:hypothetical protein